MKELEVYLRADVITDDAVVLAPVEVREWRKWRNGWTEWSTDVPDDSWFNVETRTRTVPVDLDALAEQPCPECSEEGVDLWCPTCGGRGSLRPEVDLGTHYGRPVDVLPVVPFDDDDHDDKRNIRTHALGASFIFSHGTVVKRSISTEPWAKDLHPGDVVLLFSELHEKTT